MPELRVRRAHAVAEQPADVVAQLTRQLSLEEADAVFLFVSPEYDLGALGEAIHAGIPAPVVACTTAGQIGPGGYLRGGVTGVSLSGGSVRMHRELISPLSTPSTQAISIAEAHAARLARAPNASSFGVLLIDGSFNNEEYVAAALYESLGNVPLVGGSAGSSGPHRPSAVYYEGEFRRDCAVLALCETQAIEVATFAVQHLQPSENRLVITASDPETRRVFEINGEPAARAYARALGKNVAELSQLDFARTPLLLNLGGRHLPRAIRAIDADGALTLACAIEEGLIVSIAAGGEPLDELRRVLSALPVERPELLLVFDCVLRRIELQARGLTQQVGQVLDEWGAVGFNSYGEQLGPLHLNHNLTGLVLGSAAPGGRA